MTILLFTFLSFLLLNTPAWAEHQGTEIVERDGRWYYPFHKEPLNGSFATRYANGQKEFEGTFKEGKTEGVWTKWGEHGNIIVQKTFKNEEEVQ